MRAELETHARESGLIKDGLDRDEAKRLREALIKTPGGHFFATVRSGRNLPPKYAGPAAVFGGYALTEEQINQAKGTA